MHASGCSVYAKVHSNVAAAPLLKRVLFNYALKAKLRNLHNKGEASDAGRARHATRWLLLRHGQPCIHHRCRCLAATLQASSRTRCLTAWSSTSCVR